MVCGFEMAILASYVVGKGSVSVCRVGKKEVGSKVMVVACPRCLLVFGKKVGSKVIGQADCDGGVQRTRTKAQS